MLLIADDGDNVCIFSLYSSLSDKDEGGGRDVCFTIQQQELERKKKQCQKKRKKMSRAKMARHDTTRHGRHYLHIIRKRMKKRSRTRDEDTTYILFIPCDENITIHRHQLYHQQAVTIKSIKRTWQVLLYNGQREEDIIYINIYIYIYYIERSRTLTKQDFFFGLVLNIL